MGPAGPGFQVSIVGYTTSPHSQLYAVLENYRDRLKRIAPENGHALPFYIVIPRNDLEYSRIGSSRSGTAVGFRPWGSRLGPFANVFLNQFLPPQAKIKKAIHRPTFESNFNPSNQFANPPLPQFNGMPGYGGAPFGAGYSYQGTSSAKLGIINPDNKKSLANAWAFRLKILIFLRR